jgi:hypothetical protein
LEGRDGGLIGVYPDIFLGIKRSAMRNFNQDNQGPGWESN